jgi:hypothetical protein
MQFSMLFYSPEEFFLDLWILACGIHIRNSLTYVETAWGMSEQPDVCRNSLMYVGTA